MSSSGGKRGRGSGRGSGGNWRGGGGNAPWKRGRGNTWRSRGHSGSPPFMVPPEHSLRNPSNFDDLDSDGQVTQTPQFHGAGLANNVGKLIQAFEDDGGDCFPGWDLYFPTTAYNESAPAVSTVKTFIKYFQTWSAQYVTSVERVLRDRFVEINYRYC